MTTHQIPATPEQFEQLRQEVTTIEIPYGLEGWHPNEITEWADQVAEDETASPEDLARASAAVYYALGIEAADLARAGRAAADVLGASTDEPKGGA